MCAKLWTHFHSIKGCEWFVIDCVRVMRSQRT
jgi:hypothetical protein